MKASELKWVNTDYISYAVNLLGLGARFSKTTALK